jgi:hypothetical protein
MNTDYRSVRLSTNHTGRRMSINQLRKCGMLRCPNCKETVHTLIKLRDMTSRDFERLLALQANYNSRYCSHFICQGLLLYFRLPESKVPHEFLKYDLEAFLQLLNGAAVDDRSELADTKDN